MPLRLKSGQGLIDKLLQLVADGILRLYIGGELVLLEEFLPPITEQTSTEGIYIIIYRHKVATDDDTRNRFFAGGRPSSIIIGDQLTPETVGALLSHFENKVMFQGFVWNINSFDQEGVQLGKVLAKKVLAHETDGALKEYSDLVHF